MKFIFCADDEMGFSFNGRRQSRDEGLCRFLCEVTGKLYYLPYSAPLFRNSPAAVLWQGDSFPEDGWLFLEEPDRIPPEKAIDEWILCCWNRAYPHDAKIPVSPKNYRLLQSWDLTGSSHPRITVHHYKK